MSDRLFCIRDHQGKLYGGPKILYFGNKMKAKVKRDELNKGKKKPKFFVTRGPDHRLHNHV